MSKHSFKVFLGITGLLPEPETSTFKCLCALRTSLTSFLGFFPFLFNSFFKRSLLTCRLIPSLSSFSSISRRSSSTLRFKIIAVEPSFPYSSARFNSSSIPSKIFLELRKLPLVRRFFAFLYLSCKGLILTGPTGLPALSAGEPPG